MCRARYALIVPLYPERTINLTGSLRSICVCRNLQLWQNAHRSEAKVFVLSGIHRQDVVFEAPLCFSAMKTLNQPVMYLGANIGSPMFNKYSIYITMCITQVVQTIKKGEQAPW